MTAAEAAAVHVLDPPREPTSWAPVDLADALDESAQPLLPVVLRRDDGHGLLYPGKTHTISGESETLKSWLALVGCAEQLAAGHHVLWLDFEDDARSVVGRLLALGVPRVALLEGFHYARPADPLDTAATEDLRAVLACGPTLVVLDGVTEAMALHGRSPLDNSDVAWFYGVLPRKLAAAGPAVALIDHVVKNAGEGGRGRYAIGAQHKLAGLDGAAYIMELAQPFGHGLHGIARIDVAKDRPGRVREHASGKRAAELHLRSEPDGSVFADLRGPSVDALTGTFRPTVLMERVSRVLEETGDGMSATALETAVVGKAAGIRTAARVLADEGWVTASDRPGGGVIYRSEKPYREEPEE